MGCWERVKYEYVLRQVRARGHAGRTFRSNLISTSQCHEYLDTLEAAREGLAGRQNLQDKAYKKDSQVGIVCEIIQAAL
jgi:hypothetical protein